MKHPKPGHEVPADPRPPPPPLPTLQNLELLPNATGVACQTVNVVPGAKYRLTFMYGRLETYAWRNERKARGG